jgi:hypothetical protein
MEEKSMFRNSNILKILYLIYIISFNSLAQNQSETWSKVYKLSNNDLCEMVNNPKVWNEWDLNNAKTALMERKYDCLKNSPKDSLQKSTSSLAQNNRVRLDFPTDKGCIYSELRLPTSDLSLRKKAIVTWTGLCKDGYITGKGTLKIDSNGTIQTIIATFKNGFEEGLGYTILESINGYKEWYEGEYKNGFRVQGKVEVNFGDGGSYIYEGGLKEGKFFGEGSLKRTFKDGKYSLSKGYFEDGKLNGKGLIKYSNEVIDEGFFVNDHLNGLGTRKFTDGTLIEGEYFQGGLSGKVKISYKDGSVLEGMELNNKLHGLASYTKANGDKWYQEYKDGVKVSETPASTNTKPVAVSQPSQIDNSRPNYNERQKGIDSMNCEAYAKNSTANQKPAVAYGDKSGLTALFSTILIGTNTQDYYDSCMKRLGY